MVCQRARPKAVGQETLATDAVARHGAGPGWHLAPPGPDARWRYFFLGTFFAFEVALAESIPVFFAVTVTLIFFPRSAFFSL